MSAHHVCAHGACREPNRGAYDRYCEAHTRMHRAARVGNWRRYRKLLLFIDGVCW